MARRTVRTRITGRVQGVGFRAWTRHTADTLGLNGWVRNSPDGSVEAVLSGPPETVDRMIDALRVGSPVSRVTGVEVAEDADAPGAAGFEIRR